VWSLSGIVVEEVGTEYCEMENKTENVLQVEQTITFHVKS
jgi:hypothetical protein